MGRENAELFRELRLRGKLRPRRDASRIDPCGEFVSDAERKTLLHGLLSPVVGPSNIDCQTNSVKRDPGSASTPMLRFLAMGVPGWPRPSTHWDWWPFLGVLATLLVARSLRLRLNVPLVVASFVLGPVFAWGIHAWGVIPIVSGVALLLASRSRGSGPVRRSRAAGTFDRQTRMWLYSR